MRRSFTIALLLLMPGLAACPPERPEVGGMNRVQTGVSELPVAKVNGEIITAREYNDRIDAMPEFARAEFSTVPRRKQNLAPLVQFELLADEAEERGYGDDPRTIHRLKEALAERAVAGRDRDELVAELKKETPVRMDVDAVKKALSEEDNE